MPVWTENRPMPDIPTVNGLRFDQYREQITVTRHDDMFGLVTIDDPQSQYYGAVQDPNPCGAFVYWLAGNENGLIEREHTTTWPWDAIGTVKHVITWHVFRDARRNGTAGQYWTAAA